MNDVRICFPRSVDLLAREPSINVWTFCVGPIHDGADNRLGRRSKVRICRVPYLPGKHYPVAAWERIRMLFTENMSDSAARQDL